MEKNEDGTNNLKILVSQDQPSESQNSHTTAVHETPADTRFSSLPSSMARSKRLSLAARVPLLAPLVALLGGSVGSLAMAPRVLVTGGNKGIGRALCRQLAAEQGFLRCGGFLMIFVLKMVKSRGPMRKAEVLCFPG